MLRAAAAQGTALGLAAKKLICNIICVIALACVQSPTMIPDDIRRFIVQCIPSVPFLEALLLLRDGGQRDWDSTQLAMRLYLDTAAAAELLERLERTGLLSRDASAPPRYRYAPRTAQLADMAGELAVVYAQNLVEVSTLIHLKSNRKAHVFADAFVLRKKKEEKH